MHGSDVVLGDGSVVVVRVWQPLWPCDLDHIVIFMLSHPKGAPFEKWPVGPLISKNKF